MTEALIMSITPERLGAILQGAGYRIEHRDDPNGPILSSATGGLTFNIRMGNRAQPPAEGFVDFTYIAIMKIEGEFPLEKINDWNKSKRFSRLHKADDLVIFDMEVVIAGGVTEPHVRTSMELWDRMLQELSTWLRGGVAANAA